MSILSRTTPEFRKALGCLHPLVQEAAHRAFTQWCVNPSRPNLQFTPLAHIEGIWSVRVNGYTHRALARKARSAEGEGWEWFWIGSHQEYERRLARLDSKGHF